MLAILIAVHHRPIGIEATVDRSLLVAPGSAWFTGLKDVTVLGSSLVVAAAAAVLAVECWRVTRDWRLAAICILGPGLAGVAETLLKPVIGRPRPASKAFTGESGFSFPSGHAAGSVALAVCVVAVAYALLPRGTRRAAVIAIAAVYAVVIGVSRLAVGAHRGADVMGGWLLGVAIATSVILILQPPHLREDVFAPEPPPRDREEHDDVGNDEQRAAQHVVRRTRIRGEETGPRVEVARRQRAAN